MSTAPDTTKLDRLAERYLHADAHEDACIAALKKAERARGAAWRAFQNEVYAVTGPADTSYGYTVTERECRVGALDRAKAKLKALAEQAAEVQS